MVFLTKSNGYKGGFIVEDSMLNSDKALDPGLYPA
jgi:hypothetical protein